MADYVVYVVEVPCMEAETTIISTDLVHMDQNPTSALRNETSPNPQQAVADPGEKLRILCEGVVDELVVDGDVIESKNHFTEIVEEEPVTVDLGVQDSEEVVQQSSFDCPVCGRSFSSKMGLSRHSRHHTPADVFMCSKCSCEFSSIPLWKQHLATVHGDYLQEPRSAYCKKCDECDEEFPTPFKLNRHKRIHHGDRSRKVRSASREGTEQVSCESDIDSSRGLISTRVREDQGNDHNGDGNTIEIETVDTRGAAAVVDSVGIVASEQKKVSEDEEAMEDSTLQKLEEQGSQSSKYTCSACGHQDNERIRMDRHYRTEHPNEKMWECSECSMKFLKHYGLQFHIRAVHKTDDCNSKKTVVRRQFTDYCCGLCEFVTTNKECMDYHVTQCHEKAKMWKCDQCDVCCTTSKALRNHRAVNHVDGNAKTRDKEMIVCEICGKEYDKAGLINHQRSEHSGLQPVTCPICKRSFKQKYTLNTHLIRVHNHTIEGVKRTIKTKKYERSEPCTICGKTYANVYVLRNHMKEHQGVQYQCDQCPKTFGTRTLLKSHKEVHFDLKLPCEVCGKVYTTSVGLRGHMLYHQDKQRTCNVCSKKFRTSAHLKAHMRTHTGEKPYKCDQCGRGFAQQSTLLNHVRTHTGEKPYRCNRCNKTFHRPCQLEGHVQLVHDGSDKFQCIVCAEVFPSVKKLRKHLLEEHEDELSSDSEHSNDGESSENA